MTPENKAMSTYNLSSQVAYVSELRVVPPDSIFFLRIVSFESFKRPEGESILFFTSNKQKSGKNI